MSSLDAPSKATCLEAAQRLDSALAQLSTGNADETWKEVELVAADLANRLRIRDSPEDNHTAVGRTSLPQTLTSLIKAALGGSPIPGDSRTAAMVEILRVAANLCMDHDDNRGYLLEAALPQTILLILEGYADLIPTGLPGIPLSLSIPHLKVVRNAIGLLLNCSVGYAPVRTRLTSLEAIVTILKLSIAMYPPGSWLSAALPAATGSSDSAADAWALRSGLSNWAWRAISELKDDAAPTFNAAVLPLLTSSLRAFTPPFPQLASSSQFREPSPLRTSLLQADFESLEESCMFLESLALDVEDFRLSLARGLHFPAEHDGVSCLSCMLSFVETGCYHPLWHEGDFPDVKGHEKAFEICKGAMIKAIVEVSGEEKNEDVLWDEEDPEKPGGEFVCKMIEWLKTFVSERDAADGTPAKMTSRDDMAICASLSLGNLARREKHSTTLLSPPHSIALVLSSAHLLGPTSDIRVKHGVVSLLKHLAQSSMQSPHNIAALTDAGVVARLVSSRIWEEDADPLREVVQVGAIGVAKHLCNTNLLNTFALVLPPSPGQDTGLKQIIHLGLASESVRVKSEGTRALVNAIRCLCANDPLSPSAAANINGKNGKQTAEKAQEKQRLWSEAMRAVSDQICVGALARLIGRSAKYPILVNEGILALSLLSVQAGGASVVASAIRASLPVEAAASPPPKSATGSQSSPSTSRSACVLDTIVAVLKSFIAQASTTKGQAAEYPPEIGVNVCVLLEHVGRGGAPEDAAHIKETTQPLLEELAKAESVSGKEGMVNAAAKRCQEAWATT